MLSRCFNKVLLTTNISSVRDIWTLDPDDSLDDVPLASVQGSASFPLEISDGDVPLENLVVIFHPPFAVVRRYTSSCLVQGLLHVSVVGIFGHEIPEECIIMMLCRMTIQDPYPNTMKGHNPMYINPLNKGGLLRSSSLLFNILAVL